MSKVYWESIELYGVKLYMKIHLENRRNIRSSLGKEYVIVRLPILLTKKEREKHVARSKDWVKETFAEKPNLINKYRIRDYRKNPIIEVLGNSLVVEIEKESRNTGKSTIKNGILKVIIPEDLDAYNENAMIRTLISRSLANAFKDTIKKKVDLINKSHFRENINRIQLKYNVSNWGSCSSKNNINLSTRLLLTPEWVMDYVIVHELAHLKEMNHSERFWIIVEKAYPSYKKAEKWLTDHDDLCYF